MQKNLEHGALQTIVPRDSSAEINAFIKEKGWAAMQKNLEDGALRTIVPRDSSAGINAFISGADSEWLLIYSYQRGRNVNPPLKPGILPTSLVNGGSHVHICQLKGFKKV